MGRPRGKGKKSIEAASNDDDGSGDEEVARTHKRRVRPQKAPLKDGTDEAEDIAKAEEDRDGRKPIASSKDSKSSIENNGGKKRRRRQLKQSSESVEDDDKDDPVMSKSDGFRQNGSRRKSVPRRAAEAGVVSDMLY